LGFFVLKKFIIAFSEIFETKIFNVLLYIRLGASILAFEVAKLHDSWHFLILNYEKIPPHGRGGP
jgi:hypothetical protein